jgi:hypothetical protein
MAFGLAGLAYGFAGYMLSAQTGTGDPRVSNPFLLYAFAAVLAIMFGNLASILAARQMPGINCQDCNAPQDWLEPYLVTPIPVPN